jgi:hypothetical protein
LYHSLFERCAAFFFLKMKFFFLIPFFMGAAGGLRLGGDCHYERRRLTCEGAPGPNHPVWDL